MRYKIIQDEEAFKEFIDWLPDLEDGEQFYYSLFARSKYAPNSGLKSDKAQLARGVSDKSRLYNKIKKLEVPIGTYDIGGISVPQESLALYIHPNPRSMKKASISTLKMLVDNMEKDRYQNPKSVALNALQTAKSRTVFVDFDVDYKEDKYGGFLDDYIWDRVGDQDSYRIVETKGGFHVLVQPSKTTFKNWYQGISKNQYIDQTGDLLLPVVGCCQGNFTPKFV